jgi:GMP synthase-like glutamine amidotransferase
MKRVLLVDAVESPAESSIHLGRPVERWFGAHLNQKYNVILEVVPASSAALATSADAADGVIISGSPRDAWSDSPDVLQLLEFVQRTISRSQPTLGVCFGHQLLGRGLGADVRQNPAGWEVGARKVKLTSDGLNSALFAGFDPEFEAIESHRDAVLTLPPAGKLLASNTHTPIQAFSVGERFFGVQFHPEMDGEILRFVWTERREKFRGQVGFDLDHALDSAEADASRIFHNFIAMLP